MIGWVKTALIATMGTDRTAPDFLLSLLGEPYSQSLAKGLILVFFFVTASILGTPWRQIRQAWSCAAL